MKKALLYVVVPLAILVASLWVMPFILPTSQLRSTLTQKAIAAPKVATTKRHDSITGFGSNGRRKPGYVEQKPACSVDFA